MKHQELSQCCNAPKESSGIGDFEENDICTMNDICSKCKKPFIPKWICHKCGILIGTGKPKGLMEEVEKRGYCGLCGKIGNVVPSVFYNIIS